MADAQDAGASGANRVWDMFQSLGSTALQTYRDINVARATANNAAPNGNASSTNRNPAPGTLGGFPQAQTKPSYDGVISGDKTTFVWAIVVVVVVVVLLVLPRSR